MVGCDDGLTEASLTHLDMIWWLSSCMRKRKGSVSSALTTAACMGQPEPALLAPLWGTHWFNNQL